MARRTSALTVLALLVCAGIASAQTLYAINWHTFEAGGTAVAGPYSLRAVIGQPDAGQLTGAGYSLSGGFLYTPAQPTPAEWREVVTLSSGRPLSVERRIRFGDLLQACAAVLIAAVLIGRWMHDHARADLG